jgi:hypothetical protein
MHRDNDPTFLLSSVAHSYAPGADEYVLAHNGMGPNPAQPRQETIVASRHGRPDIEARLARIEERLAWAQGTLASMKARRRYMDQCLDMAFADLAYADGGLSLGLHKCQPDGDFREPPCGVPSKETEQGRRE